jgi:O-antigen/teichoic acid export membrane protein
LFVMLMVLGSFNSFLGQILAGFKDVARRTLITNFVGSPLMMVFTLAMVGLGLGLWGYIFAQVASAAVVLVLLLAVCWKLTPSAARSFSAGIPSVEKEVLWFSAATFGMTFLEFLLGQADKILIGFYLNAREVGIYSVAAALVIFVPIILQSVNQIFSPTVAALHSRGEHELLGRMFQTLTKWILGFTVPLAAVMAIFSRPLMSIFGKDFEVGWAILMIGALGQLVNCGTGSVGFLLLMSGNQRRLIQIQVVMALVMVGMNLALIPLWGITGAAVAAAATNVLSNSWYLWAVRKTLGLSPYNRSYLRLFFPIGGTLAALFLLRFESDHVHHNWLLVAIALVVGYLVFTAVALMAGLDSDDRIIADAVWYKVRGLVPSAGGKA